MLIGTCRAGDADALPVDGRGRMGAYPVVGDAPCRDGCVNDAGM
jgi:hypothetical protein